MLDKSLNSVKRVFAITHVALRENQRKDYIQSRLEVAHEPQKVIHELPKKRVEAENRMDGNKHKRDQKRLKKDDKKVKQ